MTNDDECECRHLFSDEVTMLDWLQAPEDEDCRRYGCTATHSDARFVRGEIGGEEWTLPKRRKPCPECGHLAVAFNCPTCGGGGWVEA